MSQIVGSPIEDDMNGQKCEEMGGCWTLQWPLDGRGQLSLHLMKH